MLASVLYRWLGAVLSGRVLSLASMDAKNKTVLVRVDLNVPMQKGKVADDMRIRRVLPTIKHLASQGARVVLLSHFGRPKGQYEPSLSLAPMVDILQSYLPGLTVHFGVDCLGLAAREAVDSTPFGQVILLENLRFHWQEETCDSAFSQNLARLGDLYVNEAFSCSHRAHASTVGIPHHLPAYMGHAFEEEIRTLENFLHAPERPLMAIVGGAKVSTKLALLENLVEKVDKLFIGGAMANTFLHVDGHDMGASRLERDMNEIVRRVMRSAQDSGCEIILPSDLVVALELDMHAPCKIVDVDKVPETSMALDIGPGTIATIRQAIEGCKMLVWNGPAGAFETRPFDASTVQLARIIAKRTADGTLKSIAGGGDTVAALTHAGLLEEFTYLSTAGGAFLEWLEGKELPGIAALLLGEGEKAARVV